MTSLRALLNKFSAPQPATDTKADTPRPQHPCLKWLAPLEQRKQLLTIRHNQRDYQSLILALDTDRELLWLDEPFPRILDLEPGDELTISHHKDGQLLQFSAPVVGWSTPDRNGGLALPFPESLYHGPRRRWPRLDVFGWHPISARIAIPGLSPLCGEVINLSAGGLRLGLSGDWRAFLHHRDLLPLCELTVAPGLRVRCRARVCAYNLSQRPWRQTRVSLAFEELDDITQRELARYIQEQLQRPAHAA